jgi:hypothetical protein
MKKIICLAACLLALTLTPVYGQKTPPKTDSAPALTKFNLDFPGGTPTELVKAIEKATGKSLNAIIPTEDADIQLPPLKMNDVVAPQLFYALRAASGKTVTVQNQVFGSGYSQVTTDYGFETSDRPITDTSIWYFHADKPSLPPVVSTEKICRFYSLAPYLDRGFKVDDITTAIQTGWKMADVTSPPELDYHKETKLLIAFGEPNELDTIHDVLNTLPATDITRDEVVALRERINEIGQIESDVATLKYQVNQLTKKVTSVTSTNSSASSEENSGK